MDSVKEFLIANSIDCVWHEHSAVFTCEEAREHCGDIPGLHSKNLFLRDRKGKRLFLAVLPAEKRMDLKKFGKIVGESKIRFADSETLKDRLGLEPGSVTPFGLINDKDNSVEVYVDSDIYNAEIVSFHPNVNTATLELTKKMFHKYLEVINHKINTIDF